MKHSEFYHDVSAGWGRDEKSYYGYAIYHTLGKLVDMDTDDTIT